MEFIERHDLRKIHFLNSLTFKQFKEFAPDGKNDGERKIQFNILKEFCKTNIKTRGQTKRIYSFSLQTPLETGGRLYCGNSIQGLKKVFRGFLMDGTTDIDMKNAHPVILAYICKKHNIRCPELDYYILNRDAILSEFENKDGKTAFLKAVNDDKHNTRITNLFFKKFDKEMKEIQNQLVNLQCYKEIKSSIPENRNHNWNGSAINRILCKYENDVLQEAISTLNKNGIEICAVMFDGIMPYGDFYEDVKLLKEITNDVNNKFEGLNMEWAYKPHDTTIQIPDDFVIPVEKKEELIGVKSDLGATNVVYKLYPYWVYCLGVLYVYDKETGMWVNDKTTYYNIIKQYEKELTLLILTKDGWNTSSKSYGNTLTLMEKIPTLIKTLCGNDNWLKQQQYSSLGKLLFNNGYFDMKEGHFYSKKELNPNIVFFGKIHHNFTEFTDEEMVYMDDIENRLFFNVLGEDVGTYVMTMFAKGLAGDMMKNIMFCLGDTDCGKSTLTTAISLSCGDYVGSFNAENLAYRNTSNDEAQQMRWALLLRYKRFIFSNEMKTTIEINGNMIKKIASGGDCLIGRTHGNAEEEFITHFLPICFANDLPRIKPYDKAVDNRVRVISYKKKFVDNPDANELKMDHNLVNEMKTSMFQRVFVGMLIRRYVWANQQNYNVLPEEVKNAKKEWIETTCNYIEKFLESYEITDNEENYTRSKHIEDWIKENNLGITMTKFGIELKKYVTIKGFNNVINKCKKLEGKSIMCWIGIQEKV